MSLCWRVCVHENGQRAFAGAQVNTANTLPAHASGLAVICTGTATRQEHLSAHADSTIHGAPAPTCQKRKGGGGWVLWGCSPMGEHMGGICRACPAVSQPQNFLAELQTAGHMDVDVICASAGSCLEASVSGERQPAGVGKGMARVLTPLGCPVVCLSALAPQSLVHRAGARVRRHAAARRGRCGARARGFQLQRRRWAVWCQRCEPRLQRRCQ